MNKPLHKTPKGIQIGINYHPKVNYHNPDQDWIQAVLLMYNKYFKGKDHV
jgi:hypothetical protein